MIVDTYVQHLQEVSFTIEKTVGFLKQVLHHSLFDLPFFSTTLEEAIISIDTGTFEQVLVTPIIIEIPSSYKECISQVPLPLFLPKGRNIIQRSWINFYIGAFLTDWHTTFREGGLPCLLLLLFWGGRFPLKGFCPSPTFSLLYILDVCHNGGVLITPSIHVSLFISLFGGGFFP